MKTLNEQRELLIATRNAGKLREMQELLTPFQWRVRNLSEFPQVEEVEETGTTFVENATLKAEGYSGATQLWTLADDSGLEVDALGGAPGIYSARYAGAQASDIERINRLLSKLSQVSESERRARFVCALAIANPQAHVVYTALGYCEGHIAHAPRGVGGFGYDPIFIPDGYAQTFAELAADIKQRISHRAQALEKARVFLTSL